MLLALAPRPALAAAPQASRVSGTQIVRFAKKYLGYPYTATGDSPDTGFSCIGFVSFVYRSLGINLPGYLGGALAYAPRVAFSNLQPGDVVYFQNTVWDGLSHAGIYVGSGKFINAEWYNRGVVISSFTNDPVDGNYWTAHYLAANRPWTGASTTPVIQPTATPVPSPVILPAGSDAVVAVPALNVRSGPSTSTTVLTVVRQGASLSILGQENGWYHVTVSAAVTGWVIAGGIAAVPSDTLEGGTEGTATKPTAPQHTAPAIAPRGSVTVTVDGLRVRSGPSLDAPVIGSVNRGRKLAVIRRTKSWVNVRLDSTHTGWVSATYVKTAASTTGKHTARTTLT